MRYIRFIVLAVALLRFIPSAAAQVEKSYDPGKPRAVTPWYGQITAANRDADMNFIKGMRPHHAGALTMSNEYLSSPDAANESLKQLARGIIQNQTFEIGMLDTVEHHLKQLQLPADGSPVWGRVATRDLSQRDRFYKAPMPGPLDKSGQGRVSSRDVQFAKAMIIHHQGALDMAHDYLANPHAKNGYLELMCLDILLDQAQEIGFMQSVIGRYEGDPDDVKIDPSMIHGMEGMSHGAHGGHGAHH